MGIDLKIGDGTFHAENFSVTEEATPLAAGDSRGSVGSFTVTIPEPDRFAAHSPATTQLATFGPAVLNRKPAEITATRRGTLTGTVGIAARTGQGDITIQGISRLGLLNVYNVRAKPFVGTLGGLFTYYLGLAKVTTGFSIDSTIAGRSVAAPGWFGELWYHLKMLCAAEACEIALVGGVITFRRVGTNYFVVDREISSSDSTALPTLAQAVEVINYGTTAITNQLVYPPGGWTPEVEVLNVNAGETAEYTLELDQEISDTRSRGASVSSIQAPTMLTSVSANHSSSSVYTIVANDGLPVQPSMWRAKGGRLTISINEDTTSLKIVLKGPTGIPTRSGTEATNFAVALGSDATGNRYSTLRIVGTGVSHSKTKVTIETGVSERETATQVGVTIDNPFLRTREQVYRAGMRAAVQYSGVQPTMTAEIVSSHEQMAGEFGSVAGGRVFDRRSARWYRVASANIGPASITAQIEDDTTVGDHDDSAANRTVGDYEDTYGSLTLGESELVGIRG